MRFARVESAVRACADAAIAILAAVIGALVPITSVAAAPGDTPIVTSAASRKVHGATGTFDLPLALTLANPTTEPRQGPSQTVVFIFDKPVISGTAVVTEGTAVVGAPTFNGSEMIMPLTGVANLQYVTVAVTNVAAADGGTGGSGAVRIGYLAGDVSQNRVVSLADLGQVNAQVAQFVTAANFLKDINASGTLSLADKGLTNTEVTKALGAVPQPANQPPHTNAGTNQTITLPASATLTGSGSDDGMPNPALAFSWSKVSGPGTVNFGTPNAASTTASFGAAGIYVLRLTSSDGALTNADDITVAVNASGDLPPDPATVAPLPDRSVATNIGSSTSFLYTGANPIQTGVAAGTIELERAAVLRGAVHTRDGAALSGVTVTILAHPEFGQTVSRADGAFDLAVNGGGLLTANYQKTGFLPIQRQVNTSWQDYAVLPDVVMIALDAQVTPINLNAAAMQVARGSTTTDSDGSRRATLLIPQGTTANLVLPNGSTQPITTLSVRATEYTVGPNGPRAMPAALPPASGYTYAVELSADEAIAAGATSVNFNQPLLNYVENFLHFPVGMVVPTGFYDRAKAAWVASANGRVIRITSIAGGLATVDSVGTGSLPPIALSSAERQQLALIYGAGQELWRVPVTHFTPWDHNWPFGPPSGATGPNGGKPKSDETIDQCLEEVPVFSVIECQNQILGETLAVVGTPFTLDYRSDRVPGRTAAYTMTIPLGGASVPASLKRIDLAIQVAGRTFRQTFAPLPSQTTTFTWDGNDAYGRRLQGSQPLTGNIDFVYDGVYQQPGTSGAEAFGLAGGAPIVGNLARQEIIISQPFANSIGAWDARGQGLGGWMLSVHHAYDPAGRIVYLGNGKRQSAVNFKSIVTVAGTGTQGFNGDNVPAIEARLGRPYGVAVAPDGSLYIGDSSNRRIRRVTADGIITTVAGTGAFGSGGDGGPATQAQFDDVRSLAFGPDGSLFIADNRAHRIRRVAPDGIITTVAGIGTLGYSGDGGPATQAEIAFPVGLAVAPDGTLYIGESGNNIVRRVAPDGIISTFAGIGTDGFSGDGGPATMAQFDFLTGVALGPDGSLYIVDVSNGRIRRVAPNGIITTVAGTDTPGGDDGGPAAQAQLSSLFGLAAGPDGSLYLTDGRRIRQIGPDGIITTIAGTGTSGFSGDGGPATQAQLVNPLELTVAPDGSLYIADLGGHRIRKVAPPLPGFSGSDVAVASEDGALLYQFDAAGRHLRTLDTRTGATTYTFSYATAGQLTEIRDGDGNVTTIEHDSSGNPTAIVGPFGQETTLTVDSNGFLASTTNPAGESVALTYTTGGLLTNMTNPRGKASLYQYDSLGRLSLAQDPGGGSQTLARSVLANGHQVSKTSALGRTSTYRVERLATGDQKLTSTAPDGTVSLNELKQNGTQIEQSPDGTVSTAVLGPNPRFAMQSPLTSSLNVALPSGPTLTATNTETANLNDPLNPLSVTSLTTTATIAGRATTSTYDASSRTTVTTTAAGRTRTLAIDAFGRPIQTQTGGLVPTTFTYDSRGRLASMTRGSEPGARTFLFAYKADGFLGSITDAAGRTVQFTHDAAGRVNSKTLPDGRVVGFGYDASGNLTSLTPPGRPAHTFGYSDRDELTLVTPPALPGTGPSSFSFNLDKQVTATARPDNRTVTFGYDASGRPNNRAFATGGITTGTDTWTYDSAGRIASVTAASGVTSNYTYVGPLLAGESWTGAVSGSVTATYDTSFRLASQSVNGANPISFSYDDDSLLIGAGELAIVRDAQHGLAASSALGVVSTTTGYSGFGETVNYGATANAAALYDVIYVRDALGRISEKTETIGGVTDTYVYTYDLVGQVIAVKKNGTTVESYGYDENGNRTSATVGGVSATGVYDSQDRLTSYGTTSYAYAPAGELLSMTTGGQVTTYQYDQVGDLLAVTLPGGTSITYAVDGLDRRVAKRVNGTPVQGFLYGDTLRPVAELNAAGTLVSRFVYAGKNVPAYAIKGGVAHRIITDQVGSVRLVVNAASGAVTQRIDYDSFGNVVVDTNPGFQPFGFAGGIYDPDTRLVRFGARDYESNTGRWTAKDPIGFGGSDANLYRYVGNDPINLVDPSGHGVLLDIVGGYLGALMDSYTMINPVLGALDLFADINVSDNIVSQLGVDLGSTAFIASKIACEVIGGGLAGADVIAERRFAQSLYVESTEEVLAQARRLGKETFERALNKIKGPTVDFVKKEIGELVVKKW